MAHSMEVGIGPGHIVLLFPKRGHSPPIFGPSLLWPNGLMHQDATLYGLEVGLVLHDIVIDGDPAVPHLKGHSPPPQFSANAPLWPNGWMD